MIASMDLNAPPEPEEDEVFPQHSEEDNAQEEHIGYNRAVDHGEPALSAAQRDREERIQRIRRHRPDDRPSSGYQPSQRDDGYLSKRQRPNSKLPPGWLDCPAYGNEIGPLVPSKVPLGESFNGDIPPGKRYSFRQVIQKHKAGKIVLVIDLTNSTRYYNLNELRDGIKHVKIACKGRDSVPESEAVNKFVFEVSQFLVRRKPRNFILVHCTHGHNRTGYMIVHYLMRTTTMSVTQAIKAFAEARPPGIYKPDYIDALYIFYHEKKPDMVVCPSTPDWKRSSDLDLNGYAVPDDDDDDGDSIVPPDESHEIYLTNDDLLGDKIPNDQEIMMRQFCYQTLKLPGGIRGHQQFPGSHPVSLNRENLQLLRQRYYYATWKADGTRYMMLITMDGCYLIDRHFNFRRVQMRFPWRITTSEKGVPPEQKYHHYTLLDGEMVIDKLPDTDKQERRYLVYDMMAINHVSLVERPFVERWTMIDTEVIGPRNDERQNIYQSQNPYYRYELEPFRVRRKDFWPLSTVTKILEKFIPSLSHEADGLIFQGWDDPYVPRTHEGLLKWKYPELNSVDFLFEMVESRQQLYLFKRGKKELMNNRVVFPDGPASSYSGKIIECSWNSEEGEWVCIRVRVDKGTPNEFNTYQKVMRSIRDNITGDVLLNEINEIIRLPMYADRIEKESKGHNASRRRCARRETQHVLATVTTVADMIPQQHQESAN